MFKRTVVLWATVIAYCTASPVTVSQEELAQYVAQQQTAGIGVGQPIHRRQPYVLQPQAKAIYQSQQPKEQIYQIQPKQQPQVLLQSPKQYYQPQVEQQQQQQYYQPQAQPQPQQYYSLQSSSPKKVARPLGPQQNGELPEDYDPNPQYQFGFDIKDDEFTNYQKRTEQRDGDKISGSYSVVDADGFVRTVKYTADPLEGFKADVSREPTDIKIKFPVPSLIQDQGGAQQFSTQGLAVRKQQTQQYLASKPQVVLRPEHTQAAYGSQQGQLRQPPYYSGPQYGKQQNGVLYSQQQQYEQ